MDEETIPMPCLELLLGNFPPAEEFSEELRGAKIRAVSSNGWLVYEKKDQQEYSLWNLKTSDLINLPPLPVKELPKSFLCSFFCPPRMLDSMLILLDPGMPKSILRWRFGDGFWTRHHINDDSLGCLENCPHQNYLYSPIIFDDRRLFCLADAGHSLYMIDMSTPDHLSLVLISNSVPINRKKKTTKFFYESMLQSCGEVYVVYSVRGGLNFQQVVDFEVFWFDFSAREWKMETSLGDSVFYINGFFTFSWHATETDDESSKFKANHIYYFIEHQQNIYSFNMNDKTVSCYPRSDLPTKTNDGSQKVIVTLNREGGQINFEEALGDFCKLNLNMVSAIGKCLLLHDYMSFRLINSVFRSAAPPIQWTSATLQCHGDNSILQPWLMYWAISEGICYFIHPSRPDKKYLMNIPNNQLLNVSTSYSREGWCLMIQGEDSVFLWNPFAGKTIHLPKLSRNWKTINGCGFSPSLDRVILICNNCYLESFILKEGEWQLRTLHTRDLLDPHRNPHRIERLYNSLTFCNGAFYSLSFSEAIASFTDKIGDDERFSLRVYDRLTMPCSNYHQIFLLELNKKLLSVFVGVLGKWVRVFELDDSDMVWVEIEDLGNQTIYLSNDSSFGITAPPGMENRVYFPRYHAKEKDIVYYSLESKMLHTHNTEQVVKDFYDTKVQLYSIWIEPRWN